ncbi:MAG TPA: hypothetical protein VFU94_02305, partial [Conexibacter sp.]|nr:hypothetical protein [Conexibacter sp.]
MERGATRHLRREQIAARLSRSGQWLADIPEDVLRQAHELTISADLETLRQRIPEMSQVVYLGLKLEGSALPAELYALERLRHLTLWHAVTELPPGIARLRELRGLWLGGNRIRRLPADITALRQLEDLRIGHNELSETPPEVFELAGLRILMLHRNNLTELPAEVAKLTRLVRLQLEGNQLTRLPPEIGRLAELELLDVSGNDLSQLPPQFGELASLATLDVRNNQLTSFPIELARLRRLTSLDATGNRLDDPLPELVQRGPDAVLAYLRGLEQDGVPLYEAKVLLVGEGEVGKTSLAEALQGHAFQEGRSTT